LAVHQTTFTTDGSEDALETDLLTLKAGDTESLTVIVDGIEDADTNVEIHLYAKQDPSQDDDDADTVHSEAELSTPTRFTGARQADFSFTTTQTARLLVGRRYVVRVLLTRSGTDYVQTVMLGAIAATYPGNTVVAPSDEAYLRALGDENTYDNAVAYADSLVGVGTFTFSQISDRTTAATGITKLGTVNTGTWNATAIADTYLATISTAGKVSNSATTATSSNTASAIVARDVSGNFSAGTITATFAGNVTGNVTGNLTGNVTGNGAGTWTGSLVGNASTATLATTATTATSATTATLAATATALATPRTINGVSFDGTAAITVTAAAGTLSGTTLNATVVTSSLTAVGTIATGVWQGTAIVDTYLATISTAGKVSNSATTATANNTASAIVARDSSGNFTAGTITATSFVGTLTGNVTGNVTGSLTGNAATATNVAGTGITGTTLAATVVTSSLTTVGVLASPHMTSAVVDSGGLTITAGGLTVSASGVTVTGSSSFTGGITIVSGGLNVSANTTAVQALTATSISAKSTTSGLTNVLDTLTAGSTTADFAVHQYSRGGTSKWFTGLNASGANADSYDVVSIGVGTALVLNKTTLAATFGGAAVIPGALTLSALGSGGGLVSVGVADSGGSGFKLLRVPN
jgi:hypothetical protein